MENGRGNWKGIGCGELWREGVRNTSSHISAPDRAGSSGSPPARRFVVSVPRSRRARRAQTRPKKIIATGQAGPTAPNPLAEGRNLYAGAPAARMLLFASENNF